ncbi:hypothetical protein ACFWIN_28375, partial [Streptomyces sp. NPDC127049]
MRSQSSHRKLRAAAVVCAAVAVAGPAPAAAGRVGVRSLALVRMTDPLGMVRFEPTTVVEDVLVRENGSLLT